MIRVPQITPWVGAHFLLINCLLVKMPYIDEDLLDIDDKRVFIAKMNY